MSQASGPRVALAGMILESNAFAPPATEDDFREKLYLEGPALLDEARRAPSLVPREVSAFVRAMDETGPWQPVPGLLTACPPKGPVEAGFFHASLDRIVAALEAARPLDGVYLAQHGGMTATDGPDPDGALIAAVRAAAGPEARIVVTLDLHANISERMVEASDLLIAYQTNPHVDMRLRGEEAAVTLRKLLAGTRAETAFIRLPLVPPSVTLLTAEGPYGEMIAYGQRRLQELGGRILNVSVLGGFAFSDTPKNGVAVLVAGRDDPAAAQGLAREIAELGWSRRQAFTRRLTPLDEAVGLALATASDPRRPAVIFSDAGDNPGGGGGGDTTALLAALAAAGARGVLIGGFYDRTLAAEAHSFGVGTRFEAVFNRDGGGKFAERLALPARVLALSDGDLVGRLGIFAGRRLALGPCAALALGEDEGITAVVISSRQQAADPVFLEAFGLDIAAARVVAVKSRGHFRAGFAPWFPHDRVYEVDTPGLTSPVLERFDWRGLPRPVYPLDPETDWNPPDWP
ncbi:MAG: M81 family metallopeptidase [Kiloniellales bacterium]|nr:M81 family metallopeptidase [Kiloniellales bacterium]